MITPEKFFGGASVFVVDFIVNERRVKIMDVQVSGLRGILPAVRAPLRTGGPVFKLINVGAHGLEVYDPTGIFHGTLQPGCAGLVILLRVQDGFGFWAMALSKHVKDGTTGLCSGTTTITSPVTTRDDRCLIPTGSGPGGAQLPDDGSLPQGITDCQTDPDVTENVTTTTTTSSDTFTQAPIRGEMHEANTNCLIGMSQIAEGI